MAVGPQEQEESSRRWPSDEFAKASIPADITAPGGVTEAVSCQHWGRPHHRRGTSVWAPLVCYANQVGIVEVTQGFLSLLLTWQVSDSDSLVPRDHLKDQRGSQSPSERHRGHCHLQPGNTPPGWGDTPYPPESKHCTPANATRGSQLLLVAQMQHPTCHLGVQVLKLQTLTLGRQAR